MKYLSFINESDVTTNISGSAIEDINQLDRELGYNIPEALREYLMLMWEKTIYNEYDYH